MAVGVAMMRAFVAQQNVQRFEDLLLTENDPGKRDVLLRLLLEEEDAIGRTYANLDRTERQMNRNEAFIARQWALVEELSADGRDGVRIAKEVLDNLMRTQTLYAQYRQMLLRELKGCGLQSGETSFKT